MPTPPPQFLAGVRPLIAQTAMSVLLALLLAVGLSGCGSVHRRMTINSDPPGALVLIDGEEKGYTPTQVDFTYYGTRQITLIKDGYETVTSMQRVKTPWYQILPLDFFSDNLLPFKVTDRQEFNYQLKPQVIVGTHELINRANEMRSELRVEQ